jgi:hypothetical protein
MSTESTHPDSEELVAYLDGELSPQETKALEERLAGDAALRAELSRLQMAWDLLDVLPRGKADEDFSTTTMNLAVDQLKHEAAAKEKGRFGPALAGGGGYYAVSSIVQQPTRELERDLHFLTNFETYSRLNGNFLGERNLEFLRMLHASGLFAAPDVTEAPPPVEPTTLAALPPEKQAETIRHFQIVKAAADPSEKAKIASMRKIAEVVGADASRTELLRTYDRYHAWLQKLTAKEIREIESENDPAKRLELIRQRKQQQNQERFELILKGDNLKVLLTREDYRAYVDWLVEFVAAHEEKFMSSVATDDVMRKRIERVTEPRRRRLWLYALYVQKVGEANAIVPSRDDYVNLTSRLSEEAKKQFSAVELDEEQRRQLLKALRDAWLRASYSPPPSEKDLADILASLKPEERAKLERLKQIDLRRELVERYEKLQEEKRRERSTRERGNEPLGSSN